MKRNILLLSLSVAAVSCSVNEMDYSDRRELFYATIEQPGDLDTKVYASQDLKVLWDEVDHISIFNKKDANDEYRFTGKTGDNGGSFELVKDFSEEGVGIDLVYAVYPYSRTTSIDTKGTLSVEFPSEQHFRETSFGPGSNLMVSVSKDNNLQFKNVAGYLRIKLYGEGVSVSSITLKGNNEEKLVGDATVTMPMDGVPSVEMASDATKEITLVCDTPVELGATSEESKVFWFVVPPMTFSQGITVTITQATGGIFEKSTSKSINITRSNVSTMAPFEVEPVAPPIRVPEIVDLGLSVKWASFNLGASSPEGYGDYYAWGEIEPYYNSLNPLTWKEGKEKGYNVSSYKWCLDGSMKALTKYCNDAEYGFNGFMDNKSVLDLEDDAAHMILEDKWRMPTEEEWAELFANCTWESTTINGVAGRTVTSNRPGYTDKWIFLPAAGYMRNTESSYSESSGCYWSSTLNTKMPSSAMSANFTSSSESESGASSPRVGGRSIRPVCGEFVSIESVSLNPTTLMMTLGDTEMLTATLAPSDATVKNVIWSTSDSSVASVDSEGLVRAVSAGTATITVWASDGVHSAACSVTVQGAVPEAVDLGLPSGLKWASFNLGASKPEEYGHHYAWGEIKPKEDYNWSTYKWCMGAYNTMTKYCGSSSYGYNGFSDTKTVLDPEDDAAHVILGGKWRMPTDEEWTELLYNCSWKWMSMNGVNGFMATGPNGDSIFLSAAGICGGTDLSDAGSRGDYWSSSFDSMDAFIARGFHLFSNTVRRDDSHRYYGQSVRPVCD